MNTWFFLLNFRPSQGELFKIWCGIPCPLREMFSSSNVQNVQWSMGIVHRSWHVCQTSQWPLMRRETYTRYGYSKSQPFWRECPESYEWLIIIWARSPQFDWVGSRWYSRCVLPNNVTNPICFSQILLLIHILVLLTHICVTRKKSSVKNSVTNT